jgi:hypothetical protein
MAHWVAPPLPPNRTGGFPASGSPVGECSPRRGSRLSLRAHSFLGNGPPGVRPCQLSQSGPWGHSGLRPIQPDSGVLSKPVGTVPVRRSFPSFEGREQRCAHSRQGVSANRRWPRRPAGLLSGRASPQGQCSRWSSAVGVHQFHLPTPLRSTVISRFNATMGALSCAAVPRCGSDPDLSHEAFRSFSLQPPHTADGPAWTRELPSVGRAKGPGFANTPRGFPRQMRLLRQLALCTGRIEFTCVWDRSFASERSPRRLAATQCPLATSLVRVAERLRLSLVGFMVSSAHGARPPRSQFPAPRRKHRTTKERLLARPRAVSPEA